MKFTKTLKKSIVNRYDNVHILEPYILFFDTAHHTGGVCIEKTSIGFYFSEFYHLYANKNQGFTLTIGGRIEGDEGFISFQNGSKKLDPDLLIAKLDSIRPSIMENSEFSCFVSYFNKRFSSSRNEWIKKSKGLLSVITEDFYDATLVFEELAFKKFPMGREEITTESLALLELLKQDNFDVVKKTVSQWEVEGRTKILSGDYERL